MGALAGHYLAAYETSTEGAEADAAGAQARIALRAAADRASALGSRAQALRFLTQALGVTTEPTERAELLERSANTATLAGRYEEAESLAREAIDLRKEIGDRSGGVRATRILVEALLSGGHLDRAIALMDTGSTELPTGMDAEDIALAGQRARAYFLVEDWQPAVTIADQVLDAAEHEGLEGVVADTLITKGGALTMAGRMAEGLALMRAGTEMSETRGLPFALRGYVNSAAGYLIADFRAGLEASKAGIALAHRQGVAYSEVLLSSNGAEFAVRLGEWDWAVNELSSRVREDVAVKDRAVLSSWLAVIAAFRGEQTDAFLDLMSRDAAEVGDPIARGNLAQLKGAIAFVNGRYAEAAAEWLRIPDVKPADESEVLPAAARAMAWNRDAAGLEAIAAQMRGLRLHGAVVDADIAAMAAAQSALAGRSDEATARYVECLGTFERMGHRWDCALLTIEAAMLVGTDHPALRQAVIDARRILEELRARPFLELLESVTSGRVRETVAQAQPAGTAVSVPS